uniref:Uncharacterized protein n=1 Tax=Rhizophora mucronata TaxID=61149 RepID=A0A2P2L7L4_RHIMU
MPISYKLDWLCVILALESDQWSHIGSHYRDSSLSYSFLLIFRPSESWVGVFLKIPFGH